VDAGRRREISNGDRISTRLSIYGLCIAKQIQGRFVAGGRWSFVRIGTRRNLGRAQNAQRPAASARIPRVCMPNAPIAHIVTTQLWMQLLRATLTTWPKEDHILARILSKMCALLTTHPLSYVTRATPFFIVS
jgi:hypothetical protein